MDDQQDLDFINDKFYSLAVPNEPIKQIMFYFTVLNEVIDFHFPDNYLNYEHPYFKTNSEMQEFLSLAQSLNPELLYQNNVIIYFDNKEFFKYYQLYDDKKGLSYEFKIVHSSESTNPIFSKNYQNNFNISNIDKKEKEFEVTIQNKIDLPHYDDSCENTSEENYLEDEEKDDNFQYEYNEQYDSINNTTESDDDESPNYNNIQKFYNEDHINKNVEKEILKYAYHNQMKSDDELDDNEEIEIYTEKVKIINKLIVTKDWIDFIYYKPTKVLFSNLRTVIKGEDVIREKSISLPKNVFFYLELIFLALLICCSSTLLSWSSTLKNDQRFRQYEGRNLSEDNNNNRPKISDIFSLSLNIKQISTDFNDFVTNPKNIIKYLENTNYQNDTIIVPNKKKYDIIFKGCQLGETSGIFGVIFFTFVIYMCIRVAREKKIKYQKEQNKKKVGLNMCHIIVFVFLTLLAFILTFVAEIYIGIAFAQHSYLFIHISLRTQIILNSLMFVSYATIVIFYFMM